MDMSEDVKQLVRSKGFSIGIDTLICTNYKAKHPTCEGCECIEGCGRYTHILMAMVKCMVYKPSTFEDSLKQDVWVQKQIGKALDITTSLEALKDEVTSA